MNVADYNNPWQLLSLLTVLRDNHGLEEIRGCVAATDYLKSLDLPQTIHKVFNYNAIFHAIFTGVVSI
jgi:hypothetical protein